MSMLVTLACDVAKNVSSLTSSADKPPGVATGQA